MQGEIKFHKPKNVHFEKKGKDKNITFLLLMPTFLNFAHKMKTVWATWVVKPISKTRNVDDKY